MANSVDPDELPWVSCGSTLFAQEIIIFLHFQNNMWFHGEINENNLHIYHKYFDRHFVCSILFAIFDFII